MSNKAEKIPKSIRRVLIITGQIILVLVVLAFRILVLLNVLSCIDGMTDDGKVADSYRIPKYYLKPIIRKRVGNIFRTGSTLEIGDGWVFVTLERDPKHIEYETVRMGRYPQSKNNEEQIEWLIIDKDGEGTLLLSKYYLDAVKYSNTAENISWEKSYLRKWLNEDFYKRAFNQQEQKEIIERDIISEDYATFVEWEGDLPSMVTKDRIFILDSYEKVIYLILADNAYKSEPTEYARDKFVIPSSDGSDSDNKKADWTRFGAIPNISCQVRWSFRPPTDGDYYYLIDGMYTDIRDIGTALYIRPAMWVNNAYVEKLKNQK